MKILHVIDSEGLYGAEVMLLNLVSEQIKTGLQPTILNMRKSTSCEASLESESIKMGIDFRSFQIKTGPDFLGTLKIIHFAVSKGYVLFHSHGYKPNILLGLMPKKIRKLPLVSTLHGRTSTDKLTRMRLYEYLDALSLRFMDSVVLVNKSMMPYARLRKCKNLKLSVINNGIPLLDFAKRDHLENDEIMDFCNQGFTIGTIGRLSKEKGFKYLIEAFYLLIRKGVDALLVIIGEGQERGLLEKLVDKFRLRNKVLMPGYLQDAKKYLLYFDVFVISSLTEGLPITLLEAMQAKVPIVATKVGGIPEVLENGKGGLLVGPYDSEGLANVLSRVYYDKKFCNELTNFAYQKAVNDFTSKNMALQYSDIYLRIWKDN